MQGGSDEMLTVGSALSFGLAAGLLIGGAPRVIVVGAFIPAVAMVLTMFNRANPGRGAAGRVDARPLIPAAHSTREWLRRRGSYRDPTVARCSDAHPEDRRTWMTSRAPTAKASRRPRKPGARATATALADQVGNAGDEIRKDLGNAGDDLTGAAGTAGDTSKEAWRKADGDDSLADKVGNAGDEIRRDVTGRP